MGMLGMSLPAPVFPEQGGDTQGTPGTEQPEMGCMRINMERERRKNLGISEASGRLLNISYQQLNRTL